MIGRDLRIGRLLVVWAPLAATFLLVTGSTPVVNASINRLPGRIHEIDLAAFALFLSFIVVLHSPLFVAREIAIKLSVDRAGARRALRFCLSVALLISILEIVLGSTPLGLRLLRGFSDSDAVVQSAQRAFLFIWPAPFFIAIRGVYQAHQIQKDDTLFVGFGTLLRLIATAVLGLLIAPFLDIEGTVLGAICIVMGIVVETAVSFLRARKVARPPETSDLEPPGLIGFALPLMIANLLGVLTSLFYLRVAAMVPPDLQESSLAAWQEVRPLAWLFSAGGFALQSLATAKVRSRADEAPMLKFALLVGVMMSSGLAIFAFIPPLREWVLIDLMGEQRGGQVVAFAVPTLMVATALPLLQSFRFSVRGILISRGQTRTITLTNLIALTLIASALAFEILPPTQNGALNSYLIWIGILLIELSMLAYLFFRKNGGSDLPAPVRGPHESAGA